MTSWIYDHLHMASDELDRAETRIRDLRTRARDLASSPWLQFDENNFAAFLKQPYILIEKRAPEWYCIVPKFVNFAVGWLEFTTDSYNVFLINRFTLWLGEVPEEIREQTGLTEAPGGLIVCDGKLIFDSRAKADPYKEFLSRVQGQIGTIKKDCEFKLLAKMIDDGYLPFAKRPVAPADFREPRVSFGFSGKYQFQEAAYQEFLKLGAVGIYWMTGAGKSFFAMKCMDSIKGAKLIVVPTRTLVDQWRDYFRKYAERLNSEAIYNWLADSVKIVTYAAYEKVKKDKFALIVFDECHRLPANSFAKFSTLSTKYRIGLSASPKREDGRENYIFALTGFPIGHDWRTLIPLLEKTYHQVNVWIVASRAAKVQKVVELYNSAKKTLIFSDSIELGAQISKRLTLPHIHGGTTKRMDVARNSLAFVASRVMDMGVSLDDLEHIIEADFLFGSRQQQLQRTGRLFHSLKPARHDILMTREEYESYQKRLGALVEKGFKVQVHQ